MDVSSEDRNDKRRPLSVILRELSEEADDAPAVTVGDLVEGRGRVDAPALTWTVDGEPG